MFNSNEQRGKRQKVFMSSVEALANILAFVAAFFATPEVFGRTVGWVVTYTAARYGTGFEDFTAFGWFAVTGLLIFFGARATISTAIVAAGLAVAVRFV
ncbi:MAG: hypothetical protein KJ587_02785 [Alphaproteobacteria bacterium]|nr:hypothetical protein [Alphaproteobacteria bacterium]